MALDPELLEMLVCPRSKRPLIYFEAEGFLFCPDSKLKYAVVDDIPVMLAEEADELDAAECERLLTLARSRSLIS